MPRLTRLAAILGVIALAGLVLWWQDPLWPWERARVEHWLECEECEGNQLGSVLALGTRALPSLGRTLNTGPGARRLEALRRFLRLSYKRLENYQLAHGLPPVGISQTEYVDRFAGNYEATYRVRSAIAVARIGGPRARELLDQASALAGLRPDVRARIQFQRDSVWHP